MGNTASAITCYPLKTRVMQGRLAVEGVMVISYFLCRVKHLSLFLSPFLSLPLCMCVCARKNVSVHVCVQTRKKSEAQTYKVRVQRLGQDVVEGIKKIQLYKSSEAQK